MSIEVTVRCDAPGCGESAPAARELPIVKERKRTGSVYELDMHQHTPQGWTSHCDDGERCPTHSTRTQEGTDGK